MAETTLATLTDPLGGVFGQSSLDAINAALTAQNANNVSLRASLNSIGTQVTATKNITLAQLQALFSAPLVIVAAQGTGTLIEFVSGVIEYVKGSAAFTIGSAGNMTLSYKADASGGAASVARAATGFFDQASNQISQIKAVTTNIDCTGNLNQPLVLTIATADMTSGTGSSAILKITYRVHSGLT